MGPPPPKIKLLMRSDHTITLSVRKAGAVFRSAQPTPACKFDKFIPSFKPAKPPSFIVSDLITSFAQTDLFLFTGSETTINLNSGLYDITAYGAQGGIGYYETGGLGAEISGEFNFSTSTTLLLLVGGAGGSYNSYYSSGGGGSSFLNGGGGGVG